MRFSAIFRVTVFINVEIDVKNVLQQQCYFKVVLGGNLVFLTLCSVTFTVDR